MHEIAQDLAIQAVAVKNDVKRALDVDSCQAWSVSEMADFRIRKFLEILVLPTISSVSFLSPRDVCRLGQVSKCRSFLHRDATLDKIVSEIVNATQIHPVVQKWGKKLPPGWQHDLRARFQNTAHTFNLADFKVNSITHALHGMSSRETRPTLQNNANSRPVARPAVGSNSCCVLRLFGWCRM